MNTHLLSKDLVYVGKVDDQFAVLGLSHLESLGCTTQLLKQGEFAPIGSIAFYTVAEWIWTSNNIRVAAHRLYPKRPEWTVTTPFLVEVRPNPKGNVQAAFAEIAREYSLWFMGTAGNRLPWESPAYQTSYTELLENWFDLVAEALGHDRTAELISKQIARDKIRGRGGDVIFNQLGDTGRIVTSTQDIPSGLGGNTAYEKLSGFTTPVVSYGTSDAANLFELLQTLKLGNVLGLPVVFETYPGAHTWGYWMSGFLNPSLALLGTKIDPKKSLIPLGAKYSHKLSAEELAEMFISLGLQGLVPKASEWAGKGLGVWKLYHLAMEEVANQALSLLGIRVPFKLTTLEKICAQTEFWKMSARKFAPIIFKNAGHDVGLLRDENGNKWSTNNLVPEATIESLHKKGWWLGGSAIYNTVFSLGRYGGVVVMVKDSTQGRVNLMAKNYFDQGSGLYLAPVGLFRLTAEGQNEDWSIDPLVMLEIMHRWGRERTKLELRKIWDAMEVPLQSRHIGRKTVAKVTLDGVSISVSDI